MGDGSVKQADAVGLMVSDDWIARDLAVTCAPGAVQAGSDSPVPALRAITDMPTRGLAV